MIHNSGGGGVKDEPRHLSKTYVVVRLTCTAGGGSEKTAGCGLLLRGAEESARRLGKSARRPLPARQVVFTPQLLQRFVLELLQKRK